MTILDCDLFILKLRVEFHILVYSQQLSSAVFNSIFVE